MVLNAEGTWGVVATLADGWGLGEYDTDAGL